MGVKNLQNIVKNLIDHGKPENTPIALIRWGSKPQQKTVTGNLLDIVEKVKKAELKAPCIIVVGEVVNLRKSMKWFEKRPLMGKRIIVTRARHQASHLVENLTCLGAECLSFPTIEIIPPDDYTEIDKAIATLSSYNWIVFTSVNGVFFFFKRLFESGYDVRALNNLKTASIGPATAEKLLEFGLNSDIVPKHYRAESVIDAFSDIEIKNAKILLPRAGIARPILPVELAKMGAHVDEITVYNTIIPDLEKEKLISELSSHKKIDMITFTSSSTVTNFKNMLSSENFNNDILKKITMASIGPITTETAKKEGFNIEISAETFTIQGLCDAILKYYQK
jgi:uroporphyrinogen III methyltransferase/synthase